MCLKNEQLTKNLSSDDVQKNYFFGLFESKNTKNDKIQNNFYSPEISGKTAKSVKFGKTNPENNEKSNRNKILEQLNLSTDSKEKSSV